MQRAFDRVIKRGTIIDGLRTPRFVSDIGIRDGRITYIGDIRDAGAAEVIDAKGNIVAPGVVDLHTHYDSQIFWDPYCTMSGWHGVTSVVIGNCGFGFAPCKPLDRERCMLTMARNEAVPLETMREGMPWDWITFPEFLNSLDRTPKGVNVLSYVPLSPLLVYVMGLEAAKTRAATEDERDRIRELFNEALDAGACGFSAQYTGIDNVQRDHDGTPMVTDTMSEKDLMLFADVLRERGEGFIQVVSSQAAADKLADVSGRPVIWNALSVGTDQHGAPMPEYKASLAWLRSANDHGRRIFGQAQTLDLGYTFTMEDWNLYDGHPLWRRATLGTHEQKVRNFKDPETRRAMREEYDRGEGPTVSAATKRRRNGIETLVIVETQTKTWAKYTGYTIAELAKARDYHIIDAFLDIVVGEDLKTVFETPPLKGSVAEINELAGSPFALPGVSDGGAHTKFFTGGRYPTEFITKLVRQNRAFDLEEAHWRLSALPAYAAGIRDRGCLREGMPADIIIYDYEKLGVLPLEVLFDYPANQWRRVQRAEGYRFILVNGEITFVNGEATGRTPGKLLRHGYAAHSDR